MLGLKSVATERLVCVRVAGGTVLHISGDEGKRSQGRCMATHGRLTEFDATTEEWVTYVERLEQYFEANAVTEQGQKRAILLSACGATPFQLIRSLVAPTKPGEKAYGDIVQLVANHHNPKPSVIVQRIKFNCRVRVSEESIAAYVAALRHNIG